MARGTLENELLMVFCSLETLIFQHASRPVFKKDPTQRKGNSWPQLATLCNHVNLFEPEIHLPVTVFDVILVMFHWWHVWYIAFGKQTKDT